PGRLFIPAKCAAQPVHFVRHHRFAIPRSAEHDASFTFTARHRFRRRPDEERIIHRFLAECTEVFHFVPKRSEQFFHFFLVTKTRVICAKRNFHTFAIPSRAEESLIVNEDSRLQKRK